MNESKKVPMMRSLAKRAQDIGRLISPSFKGFAAIGAVIGIAMIGYAYAAGFFYGGLTPQQIVDRQQGSQPYAGFRRAHAKGVCIEGTFQSSGGLATYSRSPIFMAGQITPVVGRFSIGGNNPTAPDLKAGVRSLALDFRLANGERWRTAMNTPPVLAVRDPQAFFEQIAAGAPDPVTGKPDPARLAAFAAAHPEGASFRAWQASYMPSESFATERYHSINAFWLIANDGKRQATRWQAEPLEGTRVEGASGSDALSEELSRRIAAAPVRFSLNFVLALPEDPIADPSQPWPQDRSKINAGTVEITRVTAQRGGSCDGINFDPLVLPSGIEPSNDPILHARSAAYAVSLKRRAIEAAMEGRQ
jgi:catalase